MPANGADRPFTDKLRDEFEQAKRFYTDKLRPYLLMKHQLTANQAPGLGPKHLSRADDLVAKTLRLAALVPNVPALGGLTATRLAALNHGSIVTMLPNQERGQVARTLKQLSAQFGEIRLSGSEDDPRVDLALIGVDTEGIIRDNRHADDDSMLFIGPMAERKFGRRHFMGLMATFTAPPEFTVLHGRDEVGRTDPVLLVDHVTGPRLLLLGLGSFADPSQRVSDVSVRLKADLRPGTFAPAARELRDHLCLPSVDDKALAGLKFSNALPRHLAVATLAARLADLDNADTVLAEPVRFER